MKRLRLALALVFLPAFFACAAPAPANGVIRLETNAGSTGYVWTYTLENTALVTVTETTESAGNASAIGASTPLIYTLQGVKAGSTRMILQCARPWEPNTLSQLKRYRVSVDESLNVAVQEDAIASTQVLFPETEITGQWSVLEAGDCVRTVGPAYDQAQGAFVFTLYAMLPGTCQMTFSCAASDGAVVSTAVYDVTVGLDGAITATARATK